VENGVNHVTFGRHNFTLWIYVKIGLGNRNRHQTGRFPDGGELHHPTGEPKSIPKREGSIFEQPLVAGLLVRAVLFHIPPFPKVIEWIVHPSFTPFLRQLFNQAIETVFTSLYGNISAFSFSVAVSGTLWHVL